MERARARVVADQEYLRVAVEHIRADRAGWIRAAPGVGTFILWASDIPIRYTDINDTPALVIRLIWLLQVDPAARSPPPASSCCCAGRRFAEAALLALPLLYVTGVHVPLLCETRQSLPVKPLVLVLAAMAITSRPIAHRPPTDASRIRNGSIGAR